MTTMNFHRRFVSDLTNPDVIPGDLPTDAPELAALEAERRRLTAVLEETRAKAPTRADPVTYTRERAKALREGRDLPPEPPSDADYDAARRRHEQDVKAVEDALTELGDAICRTVANHPEWERAAATKVRDAKRKADELRRQADEAEKAAADTAVVEMWLRRVADGELFVPTFQTPKAETPSYIHIDTSDPRIQDLITQTRAGQPL